MPRPLRALSALLLALALTGGAAHAAEATLTLSQETAIWDDVVEARIEGVGCSGEVETYVYSVPWAAEWIVDIDLQDCHTGLAEPFSTVVQLGPLFPQDYIVNLADSIRHNVSPPPPPFDTATLKVGYHKASLDVVLPEVATDEAPFTLTFRGPASSTCFSLDPPVVEGNAITAFFADDCPFLPAPSPHIFEQQFQVGPLAAGEYEVRFITPGGAGTRPRLHRQTLVVHDTDRCVPSATALCLQLARFRVEVDWKDFENQAGKGHPIPLAGQDDSGLFWFFQEKNIELTVKVLNGCALGDHFWVFLSSGTTVEHTVTVTDTWFHRTRTYTHAPGDAAPLVADTAAFLCDR